MKKTLLALSFALAVPVFAQNTDDEVLLSIGDKKVTRGEFERIYQKNNESASFDSASLADYMKLFIDYKLKVVEAESLKMDTASSFVSELDGYRSQIEKPYFADDSTDEMLMREAYGHMQWDVHAAHILISCKYGASPADTLAAFKRAQALRSRAAKGEDFGKLARENSEDPSAKRNNGDLGYFTAFSMIYDFEKYAYSTKEGEVSPVFRTEYGYHFLKVYEKRPNPGKVHVAHIILTVAPNAEADVRNAIEKKARNIYDSLMNGASWAQMVAKYSDDKSNLSKQGELQWFSTAAMVKEFEDASFALQNVGDISEPFSSTYGYHIVKLLGKKPLDSYEKSKANIKTRLSRDARGKIAKMVVCERLKKEYGFSENMVAYNELASTVDSTLYNGTWNASKAAGLNKVIFSFADSVKFTQQDFATILSMRGPFSKSKSVQSILKDEYDKVEQTLVFNFERTQLERKYPDFKYLLQEYHDGILLFTLMDKEVWTKAATDSVGLESYYNANTQKYMWGKRVQMVMFSYDKSAMEARMPIEKANKILIASIKKNIKAGNFKAGFVEAMAKMGVNDSIISAKTSDKIFCKADNAVIDEMEWKAGNQKITDENGRVTIYYVVKPFEPMPKTIDECRGTVIADYQMVLEQMWMDGLRAKYPVTLNEQVFRAMFK